MTHLALPMPERFVADDDVSEGKPHPEAYLKGVENLKARPKACVLIEDASSGIRAARTAGMRVVALATTYPVEGLHADDVVAPALANISVTRHTGSHGGPRFELSVPSFRGGREEAPARD